MSGLALEPKQEAMVEIDSRAKPESERVPGRLCTNCINNFGLTGDYKPCTKDGKLVELSPLYNIKFAELCRDYQEKK